MARRTGCGTNTKADTRGSAVASSVAVYDSTMGPQSRRLGSVKGGSLTASLITKGSDNRGKPRVSLTAYGARYPYSLTAAEARELGQALIDGANALEAAHTE